MKLRCVPQQQKVLHISNVANIQKKLAMTGLFKGGTTLYYAKRIRVALVV
jgi:hypothetical protein